MWKLGSKNQRLEGQLRPGTPARRSATGQGGQWVYDNVSRPLYSGLKCTFIFLEVACEKYGRKDSMYQHWRWQPHGCDIPW